ncbi:hypothetical protein ACTPEO_15650 [Clostridioides difficile]
MQNEKFKINTAYFEFYSKDDGGIWNSFYIHGFREIQNNLDEVENIFFIEVD